MRLSKNASINQEKFETLTREDQLKWIQDSSLSDAEKEECGKAVLKLKSKDGKRKADKKEARKTERANLRKRGSESGNEESGDKGSQD